MDCRKRFGQRVRELRQARVWKQEYLAQRAGIGTKSVSQIERGNRDVKLSTILALAEALEVESGALFDKSSMVDL